MHAPSQTGEREPCAALKLMAREQFFTILDETFYTFGRRCAVLLYGGFGELVLDQFLVHFIVDSEERFAQQLT